MDWPARSLDLNSIENLRGELSRAVYSEGKEYTSIIKLKKGIIKKWDEISPRILSRLVSSMEKRIEMVIKNEGGSTKY